ncbi:PDZ domain-containing protein [Tuwongella immobilis]|uniref:PDZ domain-containing protein n=1 Tax=Tuwongella immobilis TaxID=692036 RepID=A0A6C2YN59_9BACT|nr:PDZ domain-containing protein [Tuwongella immobilis]VIP02876.1 serine protease : Endopeptidase DegP/Do OS=Gluconobacter thailandicus NBRC 3257 GN=NBRC3257_1105 PE=4 SV=1: PDZ_2 [Tuwongella immobilis]VTS02716.1 serine protease : Endopeptidase DegP/Do OS=Gluconobacter thailandicus NBRC 3257 GN=NBRC3257_1105 PE=4 SV=1: PDZ_2 [Tuwongella immobilis]
MTPGLMSLLLSTAIASVPVPAELPPDFRGKGYLGVQFTQQEAGVEITSIMPKTAAFRSGLRKGDILKRINGTQLTGAVEVVPLISGRRPGSVLFLEVQRGELTLKMRIQIGDRPPEADVINELPDDDD